MIEESVKEKIMSSCARISKQWGFGASMGRIWGFMLIESRPLTQSEIEKATGYSRGLVSRSLAKMREIGIVEIEKNGRELVYSLNTSLLHILSVMIENFLENELKPLLEALSEVSERMDGEMKRKFERMKKEYSELSTAIHAFSSLLKNEDERRGWENGSS